MVDKIIVKPESIRAYGNVLMEDRDINDFRTYKSALFENVAVINGETLRVFHEVYSEYTVGFNFNPGAKELYVRTDDDTVITNFSFDNNGKELQFASSLFSFDYDPVLKELYVTDVPVVAYSLSFVEDSYTAVGGVATVSAVLLGDGEPVVGGTVTFISDASTTITATTDEDGVATATITFTASTTLTASYESATATTTITVQSYLFYDDCTSDRSNEYANASIQASSRTNYLPLTYNSNGYYTIKATNNEGNHYAKWITALDGLDNVRFSCEVSTNSFNEVNRFGIIIGDANDYKSERYHIANKTLEHMKQIGTSTETVMDSHTLSLTSNTWYKMEYIVQGTSYTYTISDMNDTVLYNTTGTFDSSVITSSTTKQYGLYYLNYDSSYQKNFRNIKAEPI